jgi:hypothetical protein
MDPTSRPGTERSASFSVALAVRDSPDGILNGLVGDQDQMSPATGSRQLPAQSFVPMPLDESGDGVIRHVGEHGNLGLKRFPEMTVQADVASANRLYQGCQRVSKNPRMRWCGEVGGQFSLTDA